MTANDPLTAPILALIEHGPAALASSSPLDETVPTVVFEDVQPAVAVTSRVLASL